MWGAWCAPPLRGLIKPFHESEESHQKSPHLHEIHNLTVIFSKTIERYEMNATIAIVIKPIFTIFT